MSYCIPNEYDLMRSLFLLISVLSFSCQTDVNKEAISSGTQDRQRQQIAADLTRELKEIHKQGHINGFGVAISNQDGTLYQKGIGFSNVSEDKAYTATTIQNIGSVSKTLIGVALLTAQEQASPIMVNIFNQLVSKPTGNMICVYCVLSMLT